MKALLSFITAMLLFPVAAFSLHTYQPFFEKSRTDRAISLNFSAETGLLFGSIDEYAFSGGSKISELNWRLDPLIYAGGTAALQFQHLVFSAGFWSGFQGKAGIIEDSDWVDPYDLNSNKVTPVPYRTMYSLHDNIIHKAYFFDFNTGYLVDLGRYGMFAFVGGFNFFNIQMSARDGSLYYSPPFVSGPVYGDGIFYEQSVYIPYIGAAIALRRDMFYARGVIYFSNWLSCDAVDNHLSPSVNKDFYDSIYAAIYLHLMLGGGVQINQYVSIELTGSFSYIPVTRGDEYIVDHKNGTTSPTYSGTTGIGMELWEVRLSGVIKL